MIWHEFLRRFKPKAITTLWVFGPILLYQLFGRALEYFRIRPLGIREVLMALTAVLLVLASKSVCPCSPPKQWSEQEGWYE